MILGTYVSSMLSACIPVVQLAVDLRINAVLIIVVLLWCNVHYPNAGFVFAAMFLFKLHF